MPNSFHPGTNCPLRTWTGLGVFGFTEVISWARSSSSCSTTYIWGKKCWEVMTWVHVYMWVNCVSSDREYSVYGGKQRTVLFRNIQDGWQPSFILAGAKRMSFRGTWKEKEEPRGNEIGDVLKSTYSYCMCVLNCWKCYCFYLVEPATLSWRNNVKKGQDHQLGLVVKTFQHTYKNLIVLFI